MLSKRFLLILCCTLSLALTGCQELLNMTGGPQGGVESGNPEFDPGGVESGNPENDGTDTEGRIRPAEDNLDHEETDDDQQAALWLPHEEILLWTTIVANKIRIVSYEPSMTDRPNLTELWLNQYQPLSLIERDYLPGFEFTTITDLALKPGHPLITLNYQMSEHGTIRAITAQRDQGFLQSRTVDDDRFYPIWVASPDLFNSRRPLQVTLNNQEILSFLNNERKVFLIPIPEGSLYSVIITQQPDDLLCQTDQMGLVAANSNQTISINCTPTNP